MSTNLTFIEEIVLLSLDDTTGAPRSMPVMALGYALAGAVIADLAVLGRIDTDPTQLVVLSRESTGDPLLDHALVTIATSPTPRPVAHWLSVFSETRNELEASALTRLIARGILRQEHKKILWVFGVRRYPTVNNNEERTEVRTRLSALILGDDLPDPRDAILISLLTACHLSAKIFPGPEYLAREPRLAALAKMDLVGREVATAIDTITQAILTATPVGM